MRNNHAKTTTSRRTTLAFISTSAMAAGMAQGAVHYTQYNTVFPLPSVPASTPFDINGDGTNDFFVGFDGYTTANPQKPYVGANPSATGAGSAVLARYSLNQVTNASYGETGDGVWNDD